MYSRKEVINIRLMVTGGLGFIGSNFIKYWSINHPEDQIINVDKETYASNHQNIEPEIKRNNYEFVKADICDEKAMDEIAGRSDIIVNFAAESHVDNSIQNSRAFIESNYFGVNSLLQAARKHDLRFHQISTDEVYGTLQLDSGIPFDENSKYDPRNPYSASKAAADFLVRSYQNTYGLRTTISNCSNNFGPNQHREKLIPKTVLNALRDEKIPVYGHGNNIRDWIYVMDHCKAVDMILQKGKIGETYLVSSRNEVKNIDIIRKILEILEKNDSLIEYVADRPGHDLRYSINPGKIEEELGWKPDHTFDEALQETVMHYRENRDKYLNSGNF